MYHSNDNKMLIVDGHSDFPRHVFLEEGITAFSKHYEDYKSAGVNIIIANIFTKCEDSKTLQEALSQISNVIEIASKFPDVSIIKSVTDLDRILENDHLGIILSLEGLEPLATNLDNLRIFYELGVRSCMLTWNNRNEYGSGSDSIAGGITPLGRECIDLMNDLGILIDLSHLNEKGFWDILNQDIKPIMASHSNARSLFNHPRNLSDSQIIAIAKAGGVIGAVSYFSKIDKDSTTNTLRSCDDNTETIYDYVSQIEYMVELVGYDHVAFGFDFNEYLGDFGVDGLEGPNSIPHVIKILIKNGHDINNIEKIAGGNLIRILRSVL